MASDVCVLIVDDIDVNLLLLESILKPLLLRLVRATSGAEALRVLLREDVALVLLDVQMPDMDGFEVARLMRSRERTSRTPIIFVTGVHRNTAQVDAGYSLGAVDYILKPIVPDVLRAKVEVFVELARKAEGLRLASERLNVKLQRALDRAEEAAREASRANAAKSEFLAHMSHELRTPMNGLMGMLGLLASEQLSQEQQYFAHAAQQSAQALLVVLNDVLEFSRLEAGRMVMKEVAFDVRELFDDVSSLMSLQAFANQVAFTAVVNREVPQQLVGDSERLRQILINLVGNAVKFTEAGSIRLCVRGVIMSDGRFQLDVTVADTGPGISAEDQARIFQPFVQVGDSPHSALRGSGLGLTISRQLAARMCGDLSVESAPGKGAVFRLQARLGRSVCADLGKAESMQGIQAPRRILVVGSDPEECRAVVEYAATLGHEADASATTNAAVVRLLQVDRSSWEAAILDENLGAEELELFVRIVRRHSSLGDLRIFLLKRPGRSATPRWGSQDISGHISKPIRIAALREAVAGRSARAPDAERVEEQIRRLANRRFRILVADDDRVSRELAGVILKREGFQVREVVDGREAIAALASDKFDAAILDLQMPSYDGIEVTRIVRALGMGTFTPRLPIIAATAHVRPADAQSCRDVGMCGFLTKPIVAGRLIEIVQTVLGGEQTSPMLLDTFAESIELRAPDELPILDDAVLAASLAGDQQSRRRALMHFLEDVPALAKALLETSNCAPDTILMSHRLCGAARTVGAKRLGHAAAEVEATARQPDGPTLGCVLSRLVAEVPAAMAAVEAALSRLP